MIIALIAWYTTGSNSNNRLVFRLTTRSKPAPAIEGMCFRIHGAAGGFVRNVWQNSTRTRNRLVDNDGDCLLSTAKLLRTCTNIHNQKRVWLRDSGLQGKQRGEELAANKEEI